MSNPPKQLMPWDVRPMQPEGDKKPDALFTAVGRAMTEFGRFEGSLGALFGFLMSQGPGFEMAVRAYGSVRTFEGRMQMLKTVAEAFCVRQNASFLDVLQKSANGPWKDFGARRNEIAHGIVFPYGPSMDAKGSSLGRYYLVPAVMDAQKRPLDGFPKYCYVAADIEHYAKEFVKLVEPVVGLTCSRIDERDRHA